MNRTLNHYDAIGYAEGWNLVARPTDTENLIDKRGAIENDLRHRVMSPEARRVLRAKLAGLDNALAALMRGGFSDEITFSGELPQGEGVAR